MYGIRFNAVFDRRPSIYEVTRKIQLQRITGWLDTMESKFQHQASKNNYVVNQVMLTGKRSILENRHPDLVQDYEKDDTWNMDEMGVFWQLEALGVKEGNTKEANKR